MLKMNRLKDKVCIITGGARGMGATHGRIFAQEGAIVVLGDIRDELGSVVASELRSQGLKVDYRRLDVTSAQDWLAMVAYAEDSYGGLDILVNNAGISGSGAGVLEENEDSWGYTIAVNQTGVWLGMKHAIPAMRRRGGGAIVNVSSIWGVIGAEGAIAYQASKGAVLLMTKSAAMTYVADNIRVNTVCPGLVLTPMAEEDEPSVVNGLIATTPMKRGATAAEISWGVLYLVSDEASYVTGTELIIDGGFVTR
jgi:NAD(P)-dependent dehydrogenase (short-subunit alcohol dehydrogenase family)